ncbi:MAG: hypothetical protein JWM76_1295 [Pseudonocardiales bacterium]|nr:hypothetical protein [Pseudonocardiales bacterium]
MGGAFCVAHPLAPDWIFIRMYWHMTPQGNDDPLLDSDLHPYIGS